MLSLQVLPEGQYQVIARVYDAYTAFTTATFADIVEVAPPLARPLVGNRRLQQVSSAVVQDAAFLIEGSLLPLMSTGSLWGAMQVVAIYAKRFGLGAGAVVQPCASNVGAFSEEHERVILQVSHSALDEATSTSARRMQT